VVEAFILHLAGLGYFFFFAMILTILSVVPLGGGVVAIPIGIILLLTGNIWQGLLVLLGHFVVITNIDNVLRPQLIPKSIRINSALMMLAVFGGLALFGFLGIAIGPIIMVLVVSTLQIYLPLAESRQRARAAAKD
jgi:predicted PurR-regulated permease PerM